jgi:hypothetical protein
MTGVQTFIDRDANGWTAIDFLPGITLLPLAQPVKDGSRRIRHGSERHGPNRWAALRRGHILDHTGGYSAGSAYRNYRGRNSDRPPWPNGAFR